MKINIQYPSLIEQAYNHLLSIGLHPNKDKLYKMLVDEGMIDELSNPTQRAIDKGLVEVASNNPIERFKAENPLVAHISDEKDIISPVDYWIKQGRDKKTPPEIQAQQYLEQFQETSKKVPRSVEATSKKVLAQNRLDKNRLE